MLYHGIAYRNRLITYTSRCCSPPLSVRTDTPPLRYAYLLYVITFPRARINYVALTPRAHIINVHGYEFCTVHTKTSSRFDYFTYAVCARVKKKSRVHQTALPSPPPQTVYFHTPNDFIVDLARRVR